MDAKIKGKIKDELIVVNVLLMFGVILMLLNGYLIGLLIWWNLNG